MHQNQTQNRYNIHMLYAFYIYLSLLMIKINTVKSINVDKEYNIQFACM